jgi:septal ring factor EnvC (AmiA/AmiB activator)
MIPAPPEIAFPFNMVKLLHTTTMVLVTALVLSAMSAEAHTDTYSPRQEKALIRRLDERKKKEHRLSHRVRSLAKKAVRREGRSKHVHATKKLEPPMPTDDVSMAFYRQKGHLAWPMDSRKVTMHYGMQAYMMTPVQINNLGISIAAEKDASVKAVYAGVVDDVMEIGEGIAVVVVHGKYFTIYSDLSEANVTKGQQIATGDVVGKVGDAGELEFRIYDQRGVWFDPEKWLTR